MSYSRYKNFVKNGTVKLVPFISIPKRSSDYYIYYKVGEHRLDLLSYEYYGDPNYDWLIMQANPEYGSMEFKIPNNALLRVPFPLDVVISQYNDDIQKYNELYETNE